jgi:two-component system, cell cycle response regulator DivK
VARETVLVVDDNAVNLKLTRVLLRGAGYDVQTAADAEEALRVLHACKARLILMDVQLPGVSGLDLTRSLKADERTRDILVVALTAYAMKGDEEKALAAGCDAYVTKPIDTDALLALVARLLAGQPAESAPQAPQTPAATTPSASASDEARQRVARVLGDLRHDLGNVLNPMAIHVQVIERALASGDLDTARASTAECKALLRRGEKAVNRLREPSLLESVRSALERGEKRAR